ncbi:MAG: ABC transporter [Acidobacteria bacterium]|nr:MAG: ABC transporter [Acidobacteriota bacterium]
MHLLSIELLSKSYGLTPLFQGVTLGLDSEDRVGVVGVNGSGKTTLLRLIAGQTQPDSGRIVFATGVSIGYLPQNPPFDPDQPVLDAVFAASDARMKLLTDYEHACHELELESNNPRRLERVSELAHELEATGAWELETNARTVLSKLGVNDMSALMGTLSGGQRKRVALAHALIQTPDLLILDEPTNHLDAETITWLETYLARYRGALLLITHDRYFLDRVTGRIMEIDRGQVQMFDGNYSYYLEKKEEQELNRAVEGQKREMLIRRELAWLRRGAKARTRKSKARLDKAAELMAQPKEVARAELDISVASSRMGKKVLELHEISKAYGGKNLIAGFSYILKPADRIGVIGPNGAGKTTLLEIISGRLLPDHGSVEVGQTVRLGYYDQENRSLPANERVIDYIKSVAERIENSDGVLITASQMLEKFLFSGAMQYSPIGLLSGGEQRRLYLLRVLMGAPNVLLLDEPTNDLDIQTLITLERYLDDFAGCVIVVSHDRYFLDRTVEHIFRLESDGHIGQYPGNYSNFIEAQVADRVEIARPVLKEKPAPQVTTTPPAKRKLTFKEEKELAALEIEIHEGEQRQKEIEVELAANSSDAGLVHKLYEERERLTARLADALNRWSELA